MPRRAVRGFMAATQAGDDERAAEYLDLRNLPRDMNPEKGAEYARQLKIVLDRSLWIDLDELSRSPEGRPEDGLPRYRDRVGRVKVGEEDVDILLQQVPGEDGDRDRIWYHPQIRLRCDTASDQVRYILVEVRRMHYAHPRVDPDPARIRFAGLGTDALLLDVFAYVTTRDYGEFLEIAEDLNLRIVDIVATAGTGLAVPTQTVHVGEPRRVNGPGHCTEGPGVAREW